MELDHPSTGSGPSQVAVAQSVSPGQMFHNAAGFGIHGGQFMSVQGNVNMQPMVPYPVAAGSVVLGPQQPPQTIVSSAPSPQATVYSESGNCCSQLLRQGRGTPLYVPSPQVNLPAEYRRRGVAIGDVGRITSEGSFDFFFNIYLPATHPINANIPEDFVPLSPYDPIDVAHYDFNPGNYVCSPSVNEINRDLPEFPGGEFVFNCGEPSGAVLTLPNGAYLEKLENLENMRRYAARHAESWYKYVNETRGRGLVNGSLYLVTGWEKADSWGMASYHNVSLQNEFQLMFRPTADAANRHRYRWQGPHCRRKHADPPPVDETPLNQTTFIHAFAISVCENIWGKLFGVEVCQPADSSTFQKNSGRGFVPYGSRGSSFGWSFFFGSSHSEGEQNTRQAPVSGNGMVSDASPIPKIIHPSEIIHECILREAPNARVVITHDDDWCDVFRDDGIKPTGQIFSELQQAIFDRFEIMEEDGAVFLVAKSHMNLVKDDPGFPSPSLLSDYESIALRAARSPTTRLSPSTSPDNQFISFNFEQFFNSASSEVVPEQDFFQDPFPFALVYDSDVPASSPHDLTRRSQSFGQQSSTPPGELSVPPGGPRRRAQSDKTPFPSIRFHAATYDTSAVADDDSPASDLPPIGPHHGPGNTQWAIRDSAQRLSPPPSPELLSPWPTSDASSIGSVPPSPSRSGFPSPSLLSAQESSAFRAGRSPNLSRHRLQNDDPYGLREEPTIRGRLARRDKPHGSRNPSVSSSVGVIFEHLSIEDDTSAAGSRYSGDYASLDPHSSAQSSSSQPEFSWTGEGSASGSIRSLSSLSQAFESDVLNLPGHSSDAGHSRSHSKAPGVEADVEHLAGLHGHGNSGRMTTRAHRRRHSPYPIAGPSTSLGEGGEATGWDGYTSDFMDFSRLSNRGRS
ncbi:hypothetical protein DFH08DRAFT_945987 [Mycena albidolilacea]|uniref:Uncharacterized protein n=1 Tax=Mycena albidolilacea TaxID=1033008 RepID=A0AAD7E7D2_9AGAR|nr:hypothetical protein DFH08DRAFT_945987 [Mycena albidolilacea]